MQALAARMIAREGAGDSPVIGLSPAARPGTAAFLNGTAGTMLELDEGNQYARGHPAIHVVPALLAAPRGDGAALLTALALGYEIRQPRRHRQQAERRDASARHLGHARRRDGHRQAARRDGGGVPRRHQHGRVARPGHVAQHDAGRRHGAEHLCRRRQHARPDRVGPGARRLRGRARRRRHRSSARSAPRDFRPEEMVARSRHALGGRAQLLQAPRRLPLHPWRAGCAGA